MQRFSRGHSCHRWLEFKANMKDRLETFEFIRCPYCGDPLDKDMECFIAIELDTLHYKEKRLDNFVENILKKYYTVTDMVKSDSGIYLILIKAKGDGDKIAKSLCNGYWEVKSAFDKRHERWTLS